MKVSEFAAQAITVNGKTLYQCSIVYKIGKGAELVALVRVDLDAHTATVCDLGCERNGSKAEAEREYQLRQYAGHCVACAVIDGFDTSLFAHHQRRGNGGMERL